MDLVIKLFTVQDLVVQQDSIIKVPRMVLVVQEEVDKVEEEGTQEVGSPEEVEEEEGLQGEVGDEQRF